MAGDNLVLEQLRGIRSIVDRIDKGHGERLDRVELRLGAMEETLGHLYALGASDRDSVRSLTRRIERIERRLDLADD